MLRSFHGLASFCKPFV